MTRRIFCVIAMSACLAQAEEKLAGGPFVVNVGPRKATVAWVVQTGETKLGKTPGQLDKTAPVLRAEKVTYAGLEPGQTYYYEIPGQTGAKGRFKTPPAGRAAFSFVVYGDTRTRHDVHQRVADAIVKADPDFVVHTGDLVTDGDETGLWPIFFNIEKTLLRQTAFFPVLGNHERNNRQYFDFFDVKNPYYSFDWGGVHIAVLNSDIGTLPVSQEAKQNFWNEQARWLESDLAKAQKTDFRFVVMHHPPFTAVKARQAESRQVQTLVPIFEKFKVQAVFSGHDHNYQHHLQRGIHYLVTGGGGAPLYPVDAPIPGLTQKLESTEHYVTVKVQGDKAQAVAIALDGRVLDRVELAVQ